MNIETLTYEQDETGQEESNPNASDQWDVLGVNLKQRCDMTRSVTISEKS